MPVFVLQSTRDSLASIQGVITCTVFASCVYLGKALPFYRYVIIV